VILWLILYILALAAFSRPGPGIQPSKLPIWALTGVKIFALSQSPAICVEVSNWSNMSQSQGCVESKEMVRYSFDFILYLNGICTIPLLISLALFNSQ